MQLAARGKAIYSRALKISPPVRAVSLLQWLVLFCFRATEPKCSFHFLLPVVGSLPMELRDVFIFFPWNGLSAASRKMGFGSLGC